MVNNQNKTTRDKKKRANKKRPLDIEENESTENFSDHQVLFMRVHPDAPIPTRKNEEDAGFDLTARTAVDLKPGERVKMPTGVAFKFPKGCYGQVMPKSRLAALGLTVDGGVVDGGYVGEVFVVLVNLSLDKTFHIKTDDEIAQLILTRILTVSLTEVTELPTTDRGNRGFGSTAKRRRVEYTMNTTSTIVADKKDPLTDQTSDKLDGSSVGSTRQKDSRYICTDEFCVRRDESADDQTVEYS